MPGVDLSGLIRGVLLLAVYLIRSSKGIIFESTVKANRSLSTPTLLVASQDNDPLNAFAEEDRRRKSEERVEESYRGRITEKETTSWFKASLSLAKQEILILSRKV